MQAEKIYNNYYFSGTVNGEEHIEIGKNAFRDNHGPYPEIEISSAHTLGNLLMV
jgi:hypothetical protein